MIGVVAITTPLTNIKVGQSTAPPSATPSGYKYVEEKVGTGALLQPDKPLTPYDVTILGFCLTVNPGAGKVKLKWKKGGKRKTVDLNIKTEGEGLTALHIAAFHGDASSVTALISKGAKVDAHDLFGETAVTQHGPGRVSWSAAGVVALEVSINSQNYTSSKVAFTLFDPPVVSSLLPEVGIFYGGTTVIVHGSGLRGDLPDLQCRFGNSSANSAYDDTPLKWHGDSMVPATYSNGTVHCVSPTSAQAGAARVLSVSFESAQANQSTIVGVGTVATLYGTAQVVPSSGVVRLTSAAYDEKGSVVLSALDGDRPISSFSASFSVGMSGGSCGHAGISEHCGAEGMSFVYGPLLNGATPRGGAPSHAAGSCVDDRGAWSPATVHDGPRSH